MWQGGWGVGSSNESQLSLSSGILKVDEGVCERWKSISDSVMDIAVDIGVSNESMDDFVSAH